METTQKNNQRLEAMWQRFPGFGTEMTNAQWAKELGLARQVMRRYLNRGLTVEQVVALRGIKYPAE